MYGYYHINGDYQKVDRREREKNLQKEVIKTMESFE